MPRTSTGSSSRPSAGPPGAPAVPHGAEELRERLRSLGIVPRRSLGQSFLADPFVADAEAALLGESARLRVTEIGGGLGVLTEALLRRGVGSLRVIERDPRLASALRGLFRGRARVEEADALRADFRGEDAVVGNLPFSVAAPILTRLFEQRVPLIVALVQKEVGARYAARATTPGYGRPSIQAALYGTVEAFRTVPADRFWPEPTVDGLIVRFTARPGPPAVDAGALERVVRPLFSHRRKQLQNLLPAAAGGEEAADRLARAAGWPDDWRRLRPGDLPPEAYFELARQWPDGAPPRSSRGSGRP